KEKEFWSGYFTAIKHAVNTLLWDENDHFYYDRDLKSGAFKKVKAVSSFLPLFAGICEPSQAEYLVEYLRSSEYFGSRFPIPSVSMDDPSFGTDMWRGPVWINYNYMIALGLKDYGYKELAEDILNKTIRMVAFWYAHDGSVYEFYDSTGTKSSRRLNRKGSPIEPNDFHIRMQCIRDYGWSCSLMPEIILEESRLRGEHAKIE
ncbi:MAG TPA: trehalase family glycosidase, partial [Anaerovoracaceae bacterium]|nr:trehalase family glycosidase [Anaerovoracaceae bacterium]